MNKDDQEFFSRIKAGSNVQDTFIIIEKKCVKSNIQDTIKCSGIDRRIDGKLKTYVLYELPYEKRYYLLFGSTSQLETDRAVKERLKNKIKKFSGFMNMERKALGEVVSSIFIGGSSNNQKVIHISTIDATIKVMMRECHKFFITGVLMTGWTVKLKKGEEFILPFSRKHKGVYMTYSKICWAEK